MILSATIESYFFGGIAIGLLVAIFLMVCYGYRPKSIRQEKEMLQAAITEATQHEIDAMRTLTSFRREYHDGTGALVKEAHKLAREVARLKTVIKDQGVK